MMDAKTVKEYQGIISNAVWSYIRSTGNGNLEFDELSQYCWLMIMEEINRRGGELLDLELVKTICQRKLVSYTRQNVKNNNVSLNRIIDNSNGYADVGTDKLSDRFVNDSAYQDEIDDLLNNFEEGSPERKWLEFRLESEGVRDYGIYPPIIKDKKGYTEGNAAKYCIGPDSKTGDSRWKSLNYRMKRFLIDYFGEDKVKGRKKYKG